MYNELAFLSSLAAMVVMQRSPPAPFEHLVRQQVAEALPIVRAAAARYLRQPAADPDGNAPQEVSALANWQLSAQIASLPPQPSE